MAATIKSDEASLKTPCKIIPTGLIVVPFTFAANTTNFDESADDLLLAVRLPAGARVVDFALCINNNAWDDGNVSAGLYYNKADGTLVNNTEGTADIIATTATTNAVRIPFNSTSNATALVPGDISSEYAYVNIHSSVDQAAAKVAYLSGSVTYTLQDTERFSQATDQ